MKGLLRWASGIMFLLGTGHLTLATVADRDRIVEWADRGVWATVPLGHEPTVESLDNAVAFWAGVAGFAVPLILLACLIWSLADREVTVPAAIGWGLAAWCAVGGIMLVPSPFFVGVIPGVLIVLAARRAHRPAAELSSPPGTPAPGLSNDSG